MQIVIDRKLKRRHSDTDWRDPFSLAEARKGRERTIEVRTDSANCVHRFLADNPLKLIIGKKVYALNKKKEMVFGRVSGVYAPNMLHIATKGIFEFDDIISMEE
jgi:hypothetical protein